MSKELTKEEVIQNKKVAIKELNKLLESYINDPTGEHLKKANLISYWIKDYAHFIDFEEKFNPTRNLSYKRGNIVKLDFGFNLGKEYGGLHYGIVLDNKNAHNSPVITVIPLTSIKGQKQVHSNSVKLGNEIYRSLKLKHDTINKQINEEINNIKTEMDRYASISQNLSTLLNDFREKLKTTNIPASEKEQKLEEFATVLNEIWEAQESREKRFESLGKDMEYLHKIEKEISGMKEGSIALVNQITTVSKMRIFDPRNARGVLSGISLSKEGMEKINQKVKELYIF